VSLAEPDSLNWPLRGLGANLIGC